jgi:hypothetical protein
VQPSPAGVQRPGGAAGTARLAAGELHSFPSKALRAGDHLLGGACRFAALGPEPPPWRTAEFHRSIDSTGRNRSGHPLGTRRVRGWLLPLGLLAAVSCAGSEAPEPGRSNPRGQGPSDFQSGVDGQGLPASGKSAGQRASLPLPPPSIPAPQPGVPGDSVAGAVPFDRLIDEGDIVKLVGPTLYVLNEFRGLQVIDVSHSDAPALPSRLQILGKRPRPSPSAARSGQPLGPQRLDLRRRGSDRSQVDVDPTRIRPLPG